MLGVALLEPIYAAPFGIVAPTVYIGAAIAKRFWPIDRMPLEQFWLQLILIASATLVLILISVLTNHLLSQLMSHSRERAAAAESSRNEHMRLTRRLEDERDEQRRLLEVIQELETPLIPVRSNIAILPLVSHLTASRCELIETSLLPQIVSRRITSLLVDVAGIPSIDETGAMWLVKLSSMLPLMGVTTIVTGISARSAIMLAQLQIAESLVTHAMQALEQIELTGGAYGVVAKAAPIFAV